MAHPTEVKLWFYEKFVELTWNLLPRLARRWLVEFLFYVSPDVPMRLSRASEGGVPWYAFKSGAFGAFLWCFVGTVVGTLLNGTWSGTDPNRLYFSQDWGNIVNYILICPAYVGLSVALICLAVTRWPQLSEAADQLEAPKRGRHHVAIASVFVFVLLLGVVVMAEFMSECLNPAIYHRVLWYVDKVTSDGFRVLGALGIYYAILGFALFVTICLGAISYLCLCRECIRVGRAIADNKLADPRFDRIRDILSPFTTGYLLIKLLTFVLMLNTFTWLWTDPVGLHISWSRKGMGLALSIIGIFLVSVPRYYLELEWFHYKDRLGRYKKTTASKDDEVPSDDLRPFSTKVVVHIVDTLLISGFIFTFWSSYFW